jgi:hypothetical protein
MMDFVLGRGASNGLEVSNLACLQGLFCFFQDF